MDGQMERHVHGTRIVHILFIFGIQDFIQHRMVSGENSFERKILGSAVK
jgi:hypothetical protein